MAPHRQDNPYHGKEVTLMKGMDWRIQLSAAGLEIVDVEGIKLKETEVGDVADIEARPEVAIWDDNPIGDPGDLESSIQRFKEFFATVGSDRLCLLARLNGRIIGFLAIGRKPRAIRSVGSVSVMVNPDHQNIGIGTELLKVGIRLGRKRGFGELEVKTLEENVAMRRIAEKNKMKVEDIGACSWRDGQREITYRLKL